MSPGGEKGLHTRYIYMPCIQRRKGMQAMRQCATGRMPACLVSCSAHAVVECLYAFLLLEPSQEFLPPTMPSNVLPVLFSKVSRANNAMSPFPCPCRNTRSMDVLSVCPGMSAHCSCFSYETKLRRITNNCSPMVETQCPPHICLSKRECGGSGT